MKAYIAMLTCLYLLHSCAGTNKKIIAAKVTELPPLQESTVNIPFRIYAKPFIDKITALTPSELTSQSWPAFVQDGCDFRYRYRFVRSDIKVTCVENKALVTLAGHYQVAGSKSVCAFGRQVSPWITGSCGFQPESMRRIEISIGSFFSLMPDYTIKSQSTVQTIRPVDRCLITLLNADITNEVISNIRLSLNNYALSLDKIIGRVNFSRFVKNPGITGRKIPIKNHGYLKINLSAVNSGTLNYLNDTLRFTAGFTCYPSISSDSTNDTQPLRLPPLSNTDLDEGFNVNANAVYNYTFLDSLLGRALERKSFELDNGNILLTDVSIKGLGDQMIELEIKFTGSKSGTLYLTGSPVLDVKTQVISIPDLDYSLKSKDLLLALGRTFFDRKIVRSLRSKAVLQINDLYRQHKRQLDSMLHFRIAKNVYTTGSTHALKLTGMVIEKEHLDLQLSVRGHLNVIVSGE